jgi:hypothetical protein
LPTIQGERTAFVCISPSRTNVGPDKDSDKRQRAAIEAYARAAGYEIAETFYDAAVSGADSVGDRAGFAEMLERLLCNGARTIIVESPTSSPATSWCSSPRHAQGERRHPCRRFCADALCRGHANRDPRAPSLRRHR